MTMPEGSQKKFANQVGGRSLQRATPPQMRAAVHPLRMRILDALGNEGPSTATRLAATLGESSGATSYHLRVLGEAGLIEEDGTRGNGRERWWRRIQPVYVPTDQEDIEGRALALSTRLLHLAREEEAVRRYLLSSDSLPTEWNAAAFTGSFHVDMTADELLAFGMEWLARIEDYRRAPEVQPRGARRVVISLHAVPWIDGEAF